MFNNFKNLNKGRIRVKVIATMLAIILTLANFTLLGTYLNRVNATEIDLSNQNNKTNNENVKFEVYLDANDRGIKEKTADINSTEEKLYISASVQGAGTLKNAKIELLNTNFSLKNNQAITNIEIGTIEAEKGLNAALEITAKKQDKYNLDLLNMVSEIKLTGEYIDGSGKVTDIDVVKSVKIEWTTNEIKGEDIELSQEVITNKIYNINGADKRVVQLLVTTSLKDNKAPIKTSTIEIPNPEIGINPEEVKVASYGTQSTNGKSSIEFADGESSTWEYNEEELKTYITVNNKVKEDNTVSWVKNSKDQYVITYIYGGTEEITSPFISNVKNTMELYGRTGAVENEANIKLEKLEEVGDVVTLESSVTNNIYKGKMYIGEETEFETEQNIYVPYSQIANKITIENQADQTNIEGEANTYYKTTTINKAEALKVLGEEGTITIYNAEDKTMPLQEIKLSEETEEENYVITYEGTVRRIAIKTSRAVSEGIIEITNTKAIKIDNQENIEELQTLTSTNNITVSNEQDVELVNTNKTNTANFVEPTTAFDVSLDKETLSSQAENSARITVELKTADESNKLFKNPVIQIEMPKEITEVNLEEVALLYEDELSIIRKEVITNEAGNKVIEIELKGEQTKYNENVAQGGANIIIEANLKTQEYMASKNVEIKAACINDAETVEQTKAIEIQSKEGLVTRNTITAEENSVQEINKNTINIKANNGEEIKIKSDIINNYGDKLEDVSLIGKVSEGTVLTGAVTTVEGGTVYYSEEENPTADSESWKTNVTNYDNIKSFKIELPEGMENTQEITVQYTAKIQEDANTAANILTVNAVLAQEQIESIIKYNVTLPQTEAPVEPEEPGQEPGEEPQEESAVITITPKTTTTTLHEEQIVTYQVKVTNTSSQTLSNVTLDYAVPEGAVYTELTYAQAGEIEYTDNETLKNVEWDIVTLSPNQTISREVTLRIKTGTKQIINSASLKDAEETVIAQTTLEPVEVKEGNLTVRLSRRDNMVITLDEGDTIRYMVIVENNTNSTMNNIKITSQVPEQTSWVEDSEHNTNWNYDSNTKALEYTLSSLAPQETQIVSFVVRIDKFDSNVYNATIENSAIITTENGEQYETNVFVSNILTARWDIHMASSHNEILNEGDTVKYIIKVENIGEKQAGVTVLDELPGEIKFEKVTYYINENNKTESTLERTNVEITELVSPGETFTIEIEGTVLELSDNILSKEIENVAKISLGNGEYLESETIVNTIVNDNDNQGEAQAQTISGLAWLDQNKNGIRDTEEELLSSIKVYLLDSNGNQVAETQTSLTGNYKFRDIPNGEYMVVFEYDTQKYAVTKYKLEDVSENLNSDAISKQITLNNETKLVGVTDTITIQNNGAANIDIGLVENPKFDLSLEKLISKVIVSNSAGTTTYEYENTNFAKIEISARRIEGSTVIVEYEMNIYNEGDVAAYVTDIIDYLPEELTFNSEMNTEWYLTQDGNLHYMAIEPQAIQPGESQKVKLVLTRTLKSDSTGTIENIAEIGESTNLEGITEYDSVAGNNQNGEDDKSQASLIISIATGSPIMYVGIVIACMLVLGVGIYIIDKKVLRVRM